MADVIKIAGVDVLYDSKNTGGIQSNEYNATSSKSCNYAVIATGTAGQTATIKTFATSDVKVTVVSLTVDVTDTPVTAQFEGVFANIEVSGTARVQILRW